MADLSKFRRKESLVDFRELPSLAMWAPEPDKQVSPPLRPYYGDRQDGTPKGMGWLGPLNATSGGVLTEKTAGFNIDGREMDIPLVIPGLTEEELYLLRDDQSPTDAMYRKAIDHAMQQLRGGRSPYNE